LTGCTRSKIFSPAPDEDHIVNWSLTCQKKPSFPRHCMRARKHFDRTNCTAEEEADLEESCFCERTEWSTL